MIIKNFEINKINLAQNKLYLLYGENEGHKNEVIKNKFKKHFLNEIYNYEEKEVLENKNNFFNSILSKSFFENKKLIIISRASDKIKETIEEIVEKNIDDTTIVISSGIIEKKSKLRNLFEKKNNLICIPFYADTNKTLINICINFFKEKKISLSQQTVNLLVERCRGNRENLNNELEKIENFLKSRKKISLEDIMKLSNLAENYHVSELADNCLSKNIRKTVSILNENNYSTEDCILIIRSVLMKVKRLLRLQEEINNKKSINQAVENFKPPIFWKDKEIVKQQIIHWPLKKIKNMIININKIELLIKKNSTNSLNILSDFILDQAKK